MPKKPRKASPTKKDRNYLREVVIRYKKKRIKDGSPIGDVVINPTQVVELFADLQNEAKEKFIVVSLDADLKIICFEVVALGSLQSIFLQPADIMKVPIMVNADGIIAIHNHPKGDPSPTKADIEFTNDLNSFCDLGGIPLLDHIIMGDNDYYSFIQKGHVFPRPRHRARIMTLYGSGEGKKTALP